MMNIMAQNAPKVPGTATIHSLRKSLLAIQAEAYRRERGYSGGVVVFFAGEVAGWVNHSRPGVIAVEKNGNCHKAVGGNDRDGVEAWQPCA